MNKKHFLHLAIVCIGVACNVPKTATESSIPLPSEWPGLKEKKENNPISWQIMFTDSLMRFYVEKVLQENYDLLIARQEVLRNKASFSGTRLWFLPNIGLAAQAGMTKFGKFTVDGVGNFDTNFSPNLEPEQKIPGVVPDFFLGFNTSWEIDVWGKRQAIKRGARHRFNQSEYMLKAEENRIIGIAIAQYILLQSLDEKVKIIEKNLLLQEKALMVVTAQKEAGRANAFAVEQVRAQLLSTRVLALLALQEQRTAEFDWSLLLGQYEGAPIRSPWPDTLFFPQNWAIGAPADVLLGRPDVMAAEQALLASGADVAVARADFFPRIELFGKIGQQGFNAARFFDPVSLAYQLLGGLAAPVFQQGALRSAYQQQKATYSATEMAYKKTILRAFLEVMNVWNALDLQTEMIRQKEQEVFSLNLAVSISSDLFAAGNVSYLEVITAQGKALEAELGLLDLERTQWFTYINLFRALGAGK